MVTIPTLSTLITEVTSDLETKFGSSIPTFGKVFLRAVALVQAGKLKIMYLILAKLQKNIFVDTADPENNGGTLERWGRIKLGRNPFAATAGEYTIQVTGTISSVIPGETTWSATINGVTKYFIIDEDYALASAIDTLTVRSLESGESSRLVVSQTLRLTRPVDGVDNAASVVSEDVIPQSEEDIEDYRTAVVAAFQLEPQGGAASDYRIWADDVSGVAKVYPYAVAGQPADVVVYVEATTADSTDGNGTPSSSMLDDVAAVFEQDPDTSKDIDERGRRPLGVFNLDVEPVVPVPVDITVPSSSYTAAQQTAIESAITERLANIRPFIAAADILDLQDDVLDVNIITAEILLTYPGTSFGTVTMTVNSVGVSTYTFENGEIPYLNSITFT